MVIPIDFVCHKVTPLLRRYIMPKCPLILLFTVSRLVSFLDLEDQDSKKVNLLQTSTKNLILEPETKI